MAKKDELNSYDDLENFDSDTLLNDGGAENFTDTDDLDNLDNLDDLNLDSGLDLDIDDIAGTDDSNVDAAEPTDMLVEESSTDDAPTDNEDMLDIGQDNFETDSLDSDIELSDDDLDLSLETNIDDDENASADSEVTSEITDDDLANFDESQYSDLPSGEEVDFDLDQLQPDDAQETEDLGDSTITYTGDTGDSADDDDDDEDEDEDDYGVDLKVGPVTIEFTQVIEPESVAEEELEPVEEDFAEEEQLQDEDVATETETDENYDITNDEDLEFEVAQDERLKNLDMDNVFEVHKEDDVLNISLHDQDDIDVNDEQTDFLSGEFDESMMAIKPATESAESDDQGETEIALPEGNDLDGVENVEDNFISDDDLNALGLDETSTSSEENVVEDDSDVTYATLAEDIVIDESSEEQPNETTDDDEKIMLDGDEDLGIDLENVQPENSQSTEEQTIDFENIDDNTTMGGVAVESNLDEDIADESSDEPTEIDIPVDSESRENAITDEMPVTDEPEHSEEESVEAPKQNPENLSDLQAIRDLKNKLNETIKVLEQREQEVLNLQQGANVEPTEEPMFDELEDSTETVDITEDLSENDALSDDSDIDFDNVHQSVDSEIDMEVAETSDIDSSLVDDDGSVDDIDLDDIPQPAGTEDDDEDETIGLSGQELDDILTSTELVDTSEDEMLTEEERQELTAVPDDPSFENDDSIMSDDELAASVTITGEPIVAPNDVLHNGDLDNYENVPLPDEAEQSAENVDVDENEQDDQIVIPAESDETGDSETGDESETIDLSSFDADLSPIDENVETDENVEIEEPSDIATEDEDETINIPEEEQADLYNEIDKQAEPSDETELKKDVKNILTYLDQLFDCLPEEKVKEFAESKHFEIYRKLFEELDIQH